MALYHKYRPQKFSEVVGQDHIKKTLSNALRQDRFSHAYIFSGPRGIGKTTLARILAKALNCQNRKPNHAEPCDACVSCVEIKSDRSLDVMEIDAASNRGIDEIRELREKIRFAPSRGKYKVYIIDEVHMLTREAFNALLKTLEEPPKHAIFILATTEPGRLPETILSRAQEFSFKRANPEEISQYLNDVVAKEKFEIEPPALELIVKNASGSYRDGIMMLDQVASSSDGNVSLGDVQVLLGIPPRETLEQFVDALNKHEPQTAISLTNKLYEEGYDLKQFIETIVEYLREKMMSELDYSYLDWISKIVAAKRDMKDSTIIQLPLEMAIIEICGDAAKNSDLKPVFKPDLKPKLKEEKPPLEPIPTPKPTPKPTPSVEKEKTEIVPAKKSRQEEVGSVSISEIKAKWPEVLSRLKPENHSLALILAESTPLKVDNARITLALNNKFYAERLRETKKYEKVTNIIADVLGKKFALDCVIEAKKEDDLINDALEVFGE